MNVFNLNPLALKIALILNFEERQFSIIQGRWLISLRFPLQNNRLHKVSCNKTSIMDVSTGHQPLVDPITYAA